MQRTNKMIDLSIKTKDSNEIVDKLLELYDSAIDQTENPNVTSNRSSSNELGIILSVCEYVFGNDETNPVENL